MGNLIGAKVEIENWAVNSELISKSKEGAKKHEWLYQCTSISALKNILSTREIWLSNLKCVNDEEEYKRIDVPEYEKAFYVACFTYDSEVTHEHWEEYGNMENGVMFGFKKDWIEKKVELMTDLGDKIYDDEFKVYSNFDNALKATQDAILGKTKTICNPYYIVDFGFFQIVYDDKLKRKMSGECSLNFGNEVLKGGRSIMANVAGIIKNTSGLCKGKNGEKYYKDWTTEKEVRLKVGIRSNFDILPSDVLIPKMAVKLNDKAFQELKIKFSPDMTAEKKNENIIELKEILPNSNITII